jgi:hypothetical protein
LSAVQNAREGLDAAVRAQLSAAFERGKEAQRHWDSTGTEVPADAGAPGAFSVIEWAVDVYASETAKWHDRLARKGQP